MLGCSSGHMAAITHFFYYLKDLQIYHYLQKSDLPLNIFVVTLHKTQDSSGCHSSHCNEWSKDKPIGFITLKSVWAGVFLANKTMPLDVEERQT